MEFGALEEFNCARPGAEGLHFGFGEHAGGLLGGVEDAGDEGVIGGMPCAPARRGRWIAAHGADFDDLVEAEEVGGDSAVDGVGEGGVLFVIGLDYGGGVDAGAVRKASRPITG